MHREKIVRKVGTIEGFEEQPNLTFVHMSSVAVGAK